MTNPRARVCEPLLVMRKMRFFNRLMRPQYALQPWVKDVRRRNIVLGAVTLECCSEKRKVLSDGWDLCPLHYLVLNSLDHMCANCVQMCINRSAASSYAKQ